MGKVNLGFYNEHDMFVTIKPLVRKPFHQGFSINLEYLFPLPTT